MTGDARAEWAPDELADLEALGAARHLAYEHAESITDLLRDAVADAVRGGMSEVEAARLSGVTRMTVRSWLGKS